MRQSKKKIGFTQVDHITSDVIMPQLSPAEQLVLFRIYRQTVGWGKWFDTISLSQFRAATRFKKNDTIMNAIAELKTKFLKMSDGESGADPSVILIPPKKVNDHFDGKDLIVVLSYKTEIPDYGLPYKMVNPEKLIAARLEERAQERKKRQAERQKKK